MHAAEDAEDTQRSALMAAAQDGDRKAYAELLRECVPLILRTARRLRVPEERVDDVVQEALLTVHKARHTYDPSRSFDAWLRALAQRRAIDALRRDGRRRARELHAPLAFEQATDDAPGPSGVAERASDARHLRAAIADLPRAQREAVEHLALSERTLAEAAALTQRTTGSLKVNLHRAVKSLRARIGG